MGANITQYEYKDGLIQNQHSKQQQITDAWPNTLQMRWSAENVSVPTPNMVSSSMLGDPFENKKYNYISSYQKASKLSFKVIEQDGMMWYQFFNALSMQYFDPTILHSRNSLFILSAIVVPYMTIGKYKEDPQLSSNGRYIATHHSSEVFEFNNIIFGGIGKSITFSNAENVQALTYNATFTCPNPFQSSFNDKTVGMDNMIADEKTLTDGLIGSVYNKSIFISNIPARTPDA
jgi:hypothetical protein